MIRAAITRSKVTRKALVPMQCFIQIFALLGLIAASAYGETFPNKPIRIVTSEPGGSGDFASRQISAVLSDTLGQRVIVDNRPTTSRTLGQIVAMAPPDGYTLLLPGASFAVGTLLQKVPYDPIRDFSPITITHTQPRVVVANASVPANSIRELIDLAKAKPGVLNYASTGVGSTGHLDAALLVSMANINVVHIPFKGGNQLTTALISGEVQLAIASAGSVMPHVKSGKLKGLAVTSAQPSPLVPGLPTVAASGLPGYESAAKAGLFAPAKTPAPIIARLNREVMQAVNRPEVKERFLSIGVEPVGSTPQELTAWMKGEMTRMGKVIRDAGIRAE